MLTGGNRVQEIKSDVSRNRVIHGKVSHSEALFRIALRQNSQLLWYSRRWHPRTSGQRTACSHDPSARYHSGSGSLVYSTSLLAKGENSSFRKLRTKVSLFRASAAQLHLLMFLVFVWQRFVSYKSTETISQDL